ncbi:MAG: PadR family transcriptional regulator [Kofleriaceae bacterium]
MAPTQPSDGQVLKGLLDTLVLDALSDGDDYGFGLLERLGGALEDQELMLRETTLYPLLHRLEERGFIDSYHVPGDKGRPRRYYRLTADGRSHLAERVAEWRRVDRLLDRTLFRRRQPKDHRDADSAAALPRAIAGTRRPHR